MTTAPVQRLSRDDAGATAVEFTLVFLLVVLPLILFGMQLVLATFVRQQATAAARDGARSAIVSYGGLDNPSSADYARVVAAVRARLAFPETNISVECTQIDTGGAAPAAKECSEGLPGEDRVVVSVTMKPIKVVGPFGLFLGPLLPGDITSSSSQTLVTKA